MWQQACPVGLFMYIALDYLYVPASLPCGIVYIYTPYIYIYILLLIFLLFNTCCKGHTHPLCQWMLYTILCALIVVWLQYNCLLLRIAYYHCYIITYSVGTCLGRWCGRPGEVCADCGSAGLRIISDMPRCSLAELRTARRLNGTPPMTDPIGD